MHKITNLVLGKRDDNMVNIYLDGEYYTNVPIDFVVEYRLEKGKMLSDDDIALLEFEKMRAKAYMFVLSSVSKKSVSEHDMWRKLKDREYPDAIIREVIDRAKKYNYLDDDYYAKTFVEQNIKTKGRVRIKADLKRHGISDALIAKYLQQSDEERDGAYREAVKYSARLDMSDPKERNKLIRHLQYRGYTWDIISGVLGELGEAEDIN